ncbi:MAG: PilN domain-containing protein [Bdellovibrionales bacterium]|nr:PilN domain-containing protein [Bdellovibrionales bacterium]
MIRINLLGEKVDYTAAIVGHIAVAVASLALVVASCFWMHSQVQQQVSSLKQEKQDLEFQLAQLRKKTKQVRDLEDKKAMLKEKLSTIALLKSRKHGPVRVLDSLNDAIPERAWLEKVKERDGFIEIYGIALDNQTIAEFIGALEASPFFGDLRLDHSKHLVVEDVPLKEFMLRGKLIEPLHAAVGGGTKPEEAAGAEVALRKTAAKK